MAARADGRRLVITFAFPAALMIASGSIHAVVNAIVKGPRRTDDADPVGSRMAARAATDGASAVMLLPAIAFVPLPTWSDSLPRSC